MYIRYRGNRLLIAGLLVLSLNVILIGQASESIALVADQDLSNYWRTTYDILVRPAGARSAVETKYGLVEPNFLSNLAGGISIAQYEAIKAIPGVEIAAPEGLLTYIIPGPGVIPWENLTDPGVYLEDTTLTIDNGLVREIYHGQCYKVIRPKSKEVRFEDLLLPKCLGKGAYNVGFGVLYPLGFVEPEQEARLVGLDQAIIEGGYLTDEEPIFITPSPYPGVITYVQNLPVLLNATPYVSWTFSIQLSRVVLPSELSLEEVEKRNDPAELENLPTEVVGEWHFNAEEYLSLIIKSLWEGKGRQIHFPQMLKPEKAQSYIEASPPFPYKGLTLEARSQIPFHMEREETTAFSLKLKGVFRLERLGVGMEPVNRVPLGMYIPPLATIRYDESGQPTEPVVIRPSLTLTGPVPMPPLALTTLKAARLIAGDNCISAIRVRVGGIDKLTPAAQRKIEAIASEIHRRTGLDVDIMVGSSPRRILVHVPGIGYVEEQWVQKNVTLSYHRRIQSGHLLLIAVLLLTGGLFAADMAWADLLAHQPVLALQKALGWRSSTLMGWVLKRTFLLGVGAGVGGTALAAGALRLAHQPLPSPLWLIGVPFMVTALSLLGSLYPALEAARVPPIPLLQMSGLRHRPVRRLRGRSWGAFLFIRYALLGVARRWSRSLLAGMTAALCAGLLVVLVGVVVDRAGYLSGTLLGEYILVKVGGYHWMLVGVGFGLAAAGMGNALLAGVVERRREIGVLKAMGWRTGEVAKLFLMEGAVLGFVGGLVGVVLGVVAYLVLYQGVRVGLLWAALSGLGVTGIVGLVSAVYPAWVAARVTPAEAMRGE